MTLITLIRDEGYFFEGCVRYFASVAAFAVNSKYFFLALMLRCFHSHVAIRVGSDDPIFQIIIFRPPDHPISKL